MRHSLILPAAAACFILPAAMSGQSLRLASTSPAAGDVAAIEISIASPAGKAPTALQWEATVEGANAVFVQDSLTASGKSIHCAPKDSAAKAKISLCILMGGVDPIPNGTVARLRLTGPAPAGGDGVRVKVDKAIAVYKDLSRIELKPVELAVPVAR